MSINFGRILKSPGNQKNTLTGLQNQVKKLQKDNNKLQIQIGNLEGEKVELIQEKGEFQVKAAEKPSKIGYIVLGFFIGFLFSLLLIFTLWFLSLFTKSVSNFYSQIFCSNLAK